VYWSTIESVDDAGAAVEKSQILRTPRGGGAATVLLSDANITTALAIDGQNLYFGGRSSSAGATGALMAMPLSGGAATTLATPPAGMNIDAVAVGGQAVYWATHMYSQDNVPSGTLSKLVLATGAVSTVAATVLPAAVAVGAGGVYWTDNGKVLMVGLEGGSATVIATSETGVTGPVAVDATSVYWSDGASIWKAPLGGGTPTALASLAQGWGGATGLAVDEASIYWATQAPCASSLGCALVQKVTPK
jgi:hypothetical protein